MMTEARMFECSVCHAKGNKDSLATIDENGLPVCWLCYKENENR